MDDDEESVDGISRDLNKWVYLHGTISRLTFGGTFDGPVCREYKM